jgi:hypothetical protein
MALAKNFRQLDPASPALSETTKSPAPKVFPIQGIQMADAKATRS